MVRRFGFPGIVAPINQGFHLMTQVTHLRFDGERFAATKCPPMSRAGIILLTALAFALAGVTTHGIYRALDTAERHHEIARV